MVLANRSAIWAATAQHELAVRDAGLALDSGHYPTHLAFKATLQTLWPDFRV